MTHVTDAELIRQAISHSGLSARRWAALVRVNERTVRRWLAGDSEIRDAQLRALVERLAGMS